MRLRLLIFPLILLSLFQTAAFSSFNDNNAQIAESLANSAFLLVKEMKYTDAQKYINDCLSYDGSNSLGFYVSGVIFENKDKNIKKAEEMYRRSFTLNENNGLACFALGRIYLQQKNFNWAQYYLEKASNTIRDDKDLFFYLGNLYGLLGKDNLAILNYKKTLEFDPNYAAAHAKLGIIYKNNNKFDLAKPHLDKAIALGITDSQVYLSRGVILGTMGKFADEIDMYRRVLALDDTIASAHINLAVAYLNSNADLKKSLNELYLTIDLNPTIPEAYYNLGLVYFKQNDFVLAKKSLLKSIELNSKYVDSFLALGLVYKEEHDYLNAGLIFDKVLAIDPDRVDLLVNYAVMLMDLQKYERARTYLVRAIKNKPGSIEAHFNLGILYGLTNNNIMAKREFYKVLKLDSRNYEALNYLGILFFSNADTKNGAYYFDRALAVNPFFEEAYLNKGALFEQIGDMNSAANCYYKVLELNPKSAIAHNNLGVIYENTNYNDPARVEYVKAMELDPKLVQAYYNLGNVSEKMKRYNEALGNYEKVLQLDPDHPDAAKRIKLVKKFVVKSKW